MSKLSKALELLGASQMYLGDVYNKMPGLLEEHQGILRDAQAELLELQRLQSNVKEFIAKNYIDSKEEIYCIIECVTDNDIKLYNFIESLCDIVGYSE